LLVVAYTTKLAFVRKASREKLFKRSDEGWPVTSSCRRESDDPHAMGNTSQLNLFRAIAVCTDYRQTGAATPWPRYADTKNLTGDQQEIW